MVLLMALAMVVVAVPVASAQPCVNDNISYWPCSFSFTASQGCPGPSANLEIGGAIHAALDWRVATSTSWLSVGPPTSGSWYVGEPRDQVPVKVTNTSMSPGTYHGTITIYDWPILLPAPINSVDVPVTLTIPAPTNICYFPSAFNWTVGEGSAPSGTLEVWTDGPASVLYWWVSTDVVWLDFDGASVVTGVYTAGSPADQVPVTVNRVMSTGVHTATIYVHDGIYPCSTHSESLDVTLTILPVYTLSTSVSPPSTGSVSPSAGSYVAGTSVSLTATPASGYYVFSHWGGHASGTQNPVTITMNSNKNVTAYFTDASYSLSTSVSPSGSGSVSPSAGSFSYLTEVTLTATPNAGYTFSHWGGDASGTNSSVTITMNSDKSVTAYFSQITHTLTMQVTGDGSTAPAVGTHQYVEGTVVDLTATPDSGWHFENWTGDVADPNSPATTVTIDADKTVTANFSNIVTFPDQNLEQAIRAAIGKPSGPIYQYEVEALTQLEASMESISDLTGLEYCTGLISLNLWANYISDISLLSGLTGLTELDVGMNQWISDLSPLSGLTNLTKLRLEVNQISDLSPLSGLTSLTELRLTTNQISDLSPLSGLTSLTNLRLATNQISDIQALVDNPGLSDGDEVDLRQNPLSWDSINTYIPQLEARAVVVLYDAPTPTPTPTPTPSPTPTPTPTPSPTPTPTPTQPPPSGGGGGGFCFIATAAYGSYLDSHVQTLRDFRDQYLVTNPVGEALVGFYYKLSPPVAEFIDDHPTLKPIVRVGLLPAVALSTVAVNTTSAQKAAILGSVVLVSVALAVWLSRRRGKGVIS